MCLCIFTTHKKKSYLGILSPGILGQKQLWSNIISFVKISCSSFVHILAVDSSSRELFICFYVMGLLSVRQLSDTVSPTLEDKKGHKTK